MIDNKKEAHELTEAKKNDLNLRLQTARRFWESGEHKRAADAFREALNLEHRDPCFSRYWLASCLFHRVAFDELYGLLHHHDGHARSWRFAPALAAFSPH